MPALPLLHLLPRLEAALRYHTPVSQYVRLMEALQYECAPTAAARDLSALLKVLLLRDHRDEAKFFNLLEEVLRHELHQLLEEAGDRPIAAVPTQTSHITPGDSSAQTLPRKSGTSTRTAGSGAAKRREEVIEGQARHEKEMYFNPPFEIPAPATVLHDVRTGRDFLQTDEYFSVTRREMVKAWKSLRYHEKLGNDTEIDFARTTQRIARDGYFSAPVYYPGTVNRKDAVMVFADYRGSMTPFHDLTDRLIATAKSGGHPQLVTWFFQNYPMGHVYANANLSGPVRLRQAVNSANQNVTLAIVISDAGAARGTTDSDIVRRRIRMTLDFINTLKEVSTNVLWLNPMPEHRWKGTAAEVIAQHVRLMAPILETGNHTFHDTLRAMFKQKFRPDC